MGYLKFRRCCREKPILTPPWNCFFDLLSIAFIIIITHNGLPQGFLPLCCSMYKSLPTLCDPMDCSTPGFPILHCLPEFAQTLSIESMMTSNHFVLCCPVFLLPSIFPSIKIFSNELALPLLISLSVKVPLFRILSTYRWQEGRNKHTPLPEVGHSRRYMQDQCPLYFVS